MTRALGGNRPVGPACESEYRAVAGGAQYDAVLGARWIGAWAGGRRSTKPLN